MTGCREWHGANVRGYGVRWDRRQKKVVLLHRWVVAQIDGWDAIEREVMHTCDNPPCYRYDHLMIGTRQANVDDMMSKGRGRGQFETIDVCKRGHPFTEENTYLPSGRPRKICRACARLHDQKRRG